MIPPIFPIVAADPACTALLGTNPVRFYPFGSAPQKGEPNYAEPYVTYQVISGTPENYQDKAPDIDQATVQIDIWNADPTGLSPTYVALLDALETHGHVTRFGPTDRDAETKLYRYSFDFDIWAER